MGRYRTSGVPGGEKEKGGSQDVFRDHGKHSTNLVKDVNLQLQETEWTPISPKQSTSTHIGIKLLKSKDRGEKLLKAAKGRDRLPTGEHWSEWQDFSSETTGARKKWHVFLVLKENCCWSEFYIGWKYPSGRKGNEDILRQRKAKSSSHLHSPKNCSKFSKQKGDDERNKLGTSERKKHQTG